MQIVSSQLYSAFGLSIQSEINLAPLSTLSTSPKSTADIIVRRATSSDLFPDECSPSAPIDYEDDRPFIRQARDETILAWPEVGYGKVSQGCCIVVRPFNSVPDEIVKLHIVGSALAVILHQRKLLPLHASAVVMNNQAIAFMGEWGAGKSTTAASLLAHGATLLADDIAAIDLTATTPLVYPGIPWMKLWPESLTALDTSVDNLPRVHPEEEKRRLNVELDQASIPRPLQSLYVLDHGPKIEIEPLPRNVAILDLLANWYGSRFGQGFLDDSEQILLFKQVTNLLERVPIFRLCRPEQLGLLDEVSETVAAHAATLPAL